MTGNKPCGVDGSVGRAERWRVGQVEALDIEDGHFAGNGSGKDVDALVDAVLAHDLRTEETPRSVFGEDLDPHRP